MVTSTIPHSASPRGTYLPHSPESLTMLAVSPRMGTVRYAWKTTIQHRGREMNVTIGQLAHEVRRSVSTLRRLERQGRIPRAHRMPLTGERVWTQGEAEQIRALFGMKVRLQSSGLDALVAALEEIAPEIEAEVERVLAGREPQDVVREALAALNPREVEDAVGNPRRSSS